MVPFVEAIENGRIVKVSEEYAIQEGLLIIRRRQNDLGFAANPEAARSLTTSKFVGRKFKPYYLKNDLLSELKENFQWELQKQRRLRNLSKRQLAKLSDVSEDTIATLERGEIPDNFVALSKLEAFYGISLRK